MPNTEPEGALPDLQVAVGVVHGPAGQVLTAKRRPGTPGAGEWEFPGGKMEPGESAEQALLRELDEELGIRAQTTRPLIRVRRIGPERAVVLHTHEVLDYQGEAYGREGQRLAWVNIADLRCPPLLLSSRPLVAALQLPRTYLITPDNVSSTSTFLSQLQTTLHSGIRLVRLRCPSLDDSAYRALARKALRIAHEAGAELLLDRGIAMARELGADGVHVDGCSLKGMRSRPEGMHGWLAASCHDERTLQQAARAGVDFVVLSPVAPTASHPEAIPLGWNHFTEMAGETSVPVYALGGMTPADRETARQNGGQGVAGIRAFWVTQ